MNFTNEDGKSLIKLARDSISAYLKGADFDAKKSLKERFSEKSGAFVTLTINSDLRGCIGFTEAMYPLWETVSKAAVAAAFEDPRFPPLSESEFKRIKIEVSVLTKPEPMRVKPSEYAPCIEIGKHGLIVEKGYCKGLLLPQVFEEYKASPKQALEMTCQKAGLEPDAWKTSDCKVYRFSAEIFSEA